MRCHAPQRLLCGRCLSYLTDNGQAAGHYLVPYLGLPFKNLCILSLKFSKNLSVCSWLSSFSPDKFAANWSLKFRKESYKSGSSFRGKRLSLILISLLSRQNSFSVLCPFTFRKS